MKIHFYRIIPLVLAVIFIFSCSKKKELTTDEFIQQLTEDVEIDLSKINSEVSVLTDADKALRNYRDKYIELQEDIDSLMEKYPDSYDLKAIKINILKANPEESSKYVKDIYQKDSLNSQNQFFYGTSLDPFDGKDFFVRMIKQKKDDPFGYLGLSFSLLYSKIEDLQIPAKLAYIAILKDPSVDDSFEVLSYIFNALSRKDDLAVLQGIMLVKDPSSSSAFDNLFYHYYEINAKVKAKELLDVFVKNNPGVLTNTGIAERLMDLEMADQATTFVNEARKNAENDPLLDFIDAKLKIMVDNTSEGLSLLIKYSNANLNDRNLVYRITDNIFAEKLIGDKKYKELLQKIENGAPTIGDKIPELAGKYIDGTPYIAADMTGKVYLIDFWAEWCNPCKNEMPNVIDVYNEFNPKGFEVIGVNLDQEKEKALKYIQDNQIKWKHIYSGTGWKDENVGLFKVQGIPATYLVDKNGIIRYKNIRGKDIIGNKVSKLLSE